MKRFKQRFTGHQISVSMIMWLIAFAALTCGAGITYAVLKNDQIQVARDIKQMNEEIASCELTKEYYRSKTSSMTTITTFGRIAPPEGRTCLFTLPDEASGTDVSSAVNSRARNAAASASGSVR